MAKKTLKELWWNKRPWYKNLLFSDWKMAVIFLLAIFSSWAYHHDTQVYKEVYENPCAYCRTCSQVGIIEGVEWDERGTDWPEINLSNTGDGHQKVIS